MTLRFNCQRLNGVFLWYPLMFLAGLWLSNGCGPKRPPVAERRVARRHLVPSHLEVIHRKAGISLSWQTNRQPEDVISGYNIYVSPEESIVDLSPHSPQVAKCLWLLQTYPGDTNPRTDFERAEISNLEPGKEYYIHVRTVSAEGIIGPPSEEITVIPFIAGRIDLVPRFSGRGEGYCFATQQYVPTKSNQNDLYLFVRNDSVFAASPHRLSRYLRYAEFFTIGPSTSIDDYPSLEVTGKGQTLIHLREGITYVLSTPETCLAKFRVVKIEGAKNETVVVVDYRYQPRCGVGQF